MAKPRQIKAIEILREYIGENNYIIDIQNYVFRRSGVLTPKQISYILKFHDVKPNTVGRTVKIHPFYKRKLNKGFGITNAVDEIYIDKVLCIQDNKLHIWGKPTDDFPYYDSFFLEKEAFSKINDVPELNFDKYERQPYKHQIEAIVRLMENDRFILADDMGLGKTTSTILAALEKDFERILVICPASLKINWFKEIAMYDIPENINIISGSSWEPNKWTIVNYDILKNFHYKPDPKINIEDLIPSPIDMTEFDLVIVDEAHYLKNATSNRTLIFNDFVKRVHHRWFLTGTPITNRPVDFYNILNLVDSPVAVNWQYFAKEYCGGKQYTNYTGGKYWVTKGATNLIDLKENISDKVLRRTKKDDLDLPQKTLKPIYLDLSYSVEYNRYLKEYGKWAQVNGGVKLSDHLAKLMKIRQLLAGDKVPHTIAMAEELIEMGKKVIIFSCFTETIRAIHNHFGNDSVIIDGSVTKIKREEAVEKFQSQNKIKVFCGNIIAAGVGLTLTEAEVVIFNDLDWTPANHAQAEDRAYRIGQVNDVHVIYMLFDDSLDTMMYNSLERKKKIIAEVMGDDIDTIEFETTVLEDTVNSLQKKLF